jgi:hypothetical protein
MITAAEKQEDIRLEGAISKAKTTGIAKNRKTENRENK